MLSIVVLSLIIVLVNAKRVPSNPLVAPYEAASVSLAKRQLETCEDPALRPCDTLDICCPTGHQCCKLAADASGKSCAPATGSCCDAFGHACPEDHVCCGEACMPKDSVCCPEISGGEASYCPADTVCANENQWCEDPSAVSSATMLSMSSIVVFASLFTQ